MEKEAKGLQWLHGIEEYLEFNKDTSARSYIRLILDLLYADKPVITEATGDVDYSNFIYLLKNYTSNPLFEKMARYSRLGYNFINLTDAFSRGQVKSKVWLSNELKTLNIQADNLLLIGSWYGQLMMYLDHINYKKARLIDLDREACVISDSVFNHHKIDDHVIKSICANIDDLELHQNGYMLSVENFSTGNNYNEKFLPNLIINTSAEHMDDSWFERIRFKKLISDPIVVIQTNNLFDADGHINCVHSVNHLTKKFPMREVMFAGELKLQNYKRFMLIGKV
jgi:hypothetical protein